MYCAERFGFSKPEAFVIEWKYNYGGSFTMALAELLAIADNNNLEKLRLAFPDEVEGYVNYTKVRGWWQDLRNRFEEINKSDYLITIPKNNTEKINRWRN